MLSTTGVARLPNFNVNVLKGSGLNTQDKQLKKANVSKVGWNSISHGHEVLWDVTLCQRYFNKLIYDDLWVQWNEMTDLTQHTLRACARLLTWIILLLLPQYALSTWKVSDRGLLFGQTVFVSIGNTQQLTTLANGLSCLRRRFFLQIF